MLLLKGINEKKVKIRLIKDTNLCLNYVDKQIGNFKR